MGIAKYNKTNVVFHIDTEGFEYKKISDLKEGKHYPLCGMFVSKDSGYGEGAVLITDTCYVNIPERYVDTIRAMMSDPEIVQQIDSGKAEFSYETFESKKYHRTGYGIIFHDK